MNCNLEMILFLADKGLVGVGEVEALVSVHTEGGHWPVHVAAVVVGVGGQGKVNDELRTRKPTHIGMKFS